MKAYQNELIDIIAERTGQKREIVAAYITAHFEEIESLLTKTSLAKVNGFGVFRIMNTSTGKKVLFLPKFDDNIEDVKKDAQEAKTTAIETANLTSSLNDDFEFVSQTEILSDTSQPETLSESSDDDTPVDLSEIFDDEEEDEVEEEEETEDSTDPYSTWDDFYTKKKKAYSWGTAILVIIAIVLIGIIVAMSY